MPIGSPQWMYASGEDFTLDQSLKFEDGDSAYLSRTPAGAGNRKTFTFSGWVKRGNISVQQTLMSVNNGSDNSTILHIYLASDDEITISFQAFTLTTTPLLRDTSAWYHIMFVADTTQASEANRFKIYLNGTQLTLGSSGTFIAQDTDLAFNQATEHCIGRRDNDNDRYFDGYLAEVHFIDGTALTPSSFGETGDYGEWKPKEVSGLTYGTNGFYLPFKQDYTVEGFSTVTWKGNAGNHYIGGVGFKPDLVWGKDREGTDNHHLFDAIRGTNQRLISNSTAAENTESNCLNSFDTDGFTLGSNTGLNSTEKHVAWCWDMGGSNATNTNGDITSTVRANTTYGQSIVSYTSNYTGGQSAQTVGHGLSSQPEMIIVKKRAGGDAYNWAVWHTGLSNNDGSKQLWLNSSDSEKSEDMFSDDIFPSNSSTVFSTGPNNHTNYPNGATYIAYCFHSVTGYSKFGSYTGNGSTSGPTVTLGFEPAFIMVKRTDDSNDWGIIDNLRKAGSQSYKLLAANISDAEDSGANYVDISSTGFTIKQTSAFINASSGTYIYMAFADKREYAYWLDQSGNNNDWTSNNLTESDISVDSPTNNFATLNPLALGISTFGGSLSEGNLKWLQGTGNYHANTRSTIAVDSGKWYFEGLCVTASGDSQMIGIISETSKAPPVDGSQLNQSEGNPARAFECRGYKNVNTTTTTGWSTAWTGGGDILGVAIDFTGGTGSIYLYLNGSLQGGGAAYTDIDLTNKWHFAVSGYSADIWIANFGQDSSFAGTKTAQGNQDSNDIGDFYYTPPSGYLALCTSNLSAVAVTPSEHFNTILYTGDDVTGRAITGVGFSPSLVWVKERNATAHHVLHDAVRGASGGRLSSNRTNAEDASTSIASFDSDGYTVGSSAAYINSNSATIVAWNWKANGSGSANTDGSVTTTVSANPDAGFSIVTYTGTGASATFGHGLSKAPEISFYKVRSDAYQWMVYTGNTTSTTGLVLNGVDAGYSPGGTYGTHGASTFNLLTNADVNGSSKTYVSYHFHSVDGYSKVGTYTGNGNADGTFVYTGFRPAWVMYKRIDVANDWNIKDTERASYNGMDIFIQANVASTEQDSDSHQADFLSNGFKARNPHTEGNADGGAYIYLAFAETPFKYSNAR